jgi:hypothetical protein
VVVAAEGPAARYVVIDGYKRIAALERLGRDTVEAVVWLMSEAAAVLRDRSLRRSEHKTALEVGLLLAELERRFDHGLDELARRFDRSVSWVSRRLALVEILPEAIQQQVREGQAQPPALCFAFPIQKRAWQGAGGSRRPECNPARGCTSPGISWPASGAPRRAAGQLRRILE